MVKIFDAHCHFGRFGIQRFKGNNVEIFRDRELASVEDMEKYMQKNNIMKVVAVPHYTPDLETPFKEFNPLVLETLDKVNVFYGGLWVNPAKPDMTKEVLKAFNHPKLVALKLSPANWPQNITANPDTWPEKFRHSMELVIQFAKQEKIILQVHTGHGASSIFEYEKFMEKYGDNLKIQFLHMGGFYRYIFNKGYGAAFYAERDDGKMRRRS
jgi:predicted TIM-barrel fold metal-dependent hydrolase